MNYNEWEFEQWKERQRQRAKTREQRKQIERRKAQLVFAVLLIAAFICALIHMKTEAAAVIRPDVRRAPAQVMMQEPMGMVLIIEQPEEEAAEEQPEEVPFVQYLREDVPLSDELQTALWEACELYSVPYELALGLIDGESSFRENVVSKAGCYGLTQLNPRFFPSGLSPADNIRTGMEYMGSLIDKYGDISAALTAYNAGHDTGHRGYANYILGKAAGWGYVA